MDPKNPEKETKEVSVQGESHSDPAAIPLGTVSGFAVNEDEAESDELQPLTGSGFGGSCDGNYGRWDVGG